HNVGQVGPGVDDITNAYYAHRNAFEFVVGHPARNNEGQRAGRRMAKTGLALDPAIVSSMYGGTASDQADRAIYEVKIADGRGRLGAGHPVRPQNEAGYPLVTDATLLDTFAQAMDHGDPGHSRPFDRSVMDGAHQNLAPRTGLMLGERV